MKKVIRLTEKQRQAAEASLIKIGRLAKAELGLREVLAVVGPGDVTNLRQYLGLTRAELARQLTVSKAWITNIEKGEKPIPIAMLIEIKELVMRRLAQGISHEIEEKQEME